MRNWVAFCAKDQNKDFAWNVEQNYTLAQIKHMASILFQFLKSSARLYYVVWVFVLLSFALMRRNAGKMVLGGQHRICWVFFPGWEL